MTDMTDLTPAEPYQHGTRVTLDPVPLAVVRHEGVSLDDLRDLFDAAYPAIGGLLGSGALVPAGPALAVYHGDPQESFDIEIGFPVVEPPDSPITVGDLQVVAAALPAGPALVATHLGSYDGLGEAWDRLIQTANSTPTGDWIEVYVSDPSDSAADLRTDLLMPVRD